MELEPDKLLAMINVVFLLIFAYVVGYKWRWQRKNYELKLESLENFVHTQNETSNKYCATMVNVRLSNIELTKTVTSLINSVDSLVQVLDTTNTDDNEQL